MVLARVILLTSVFLLGCSADSYDGAAVLPNHRVSFMVKESRLGEVFYVSADALWCAKASNKMYIYDEAPTTLKPIGTANIAVKRNDKGFDVDLSNNSDMFIPLDPFSDASYSIVTSITVPSPTEGQKVEIAK